MPTSVEKLRDFYLNLISRDDIEEESELNKRIRQFDTYIQESNPDLTNMDLIIESFLDAACMSISSGVLRTPPSEFIFNINQLENLGGINQIENSLNVGRRNSKPWFFEVRVRAWYSNHFGRMFSDLDDEYDQSVCEFAIDINGVRSQVIECKRKTDRLSEVAEEPFKNWYRRRYEKAISQFKSTESPEIEDLYHPKRHLIIGVTDVATGVGSTEESLSDECDYEVVGCRERDIQKVKKWIREVHNDENLRVDQITIVWNNYYLDNGVRKGLTENTEKVFADDQVVDYEGWNIYGHTLQTSEFRRIMLHHEPKEDKWVVFGMGGDHQRAFIQDAAQNTSEENSDE